MTLEIIGAGFGRTSTDSMRHALNMLGVEPTLHIYELDEGAMPWDFKSNPPEPRRRITGHQPSAIVMQATATTDCDFGRQMAVGGCSCCARPVRCGVCHRGKPLGLAPKTNGRSQTPDSAYRSRVRDYIYPHCQMEKGQAGSLRSLLSHNY